MMSNLLTPEILAALANQPTWTVVTPQAPPDVARMMSGSTTTAPPDAAHVAPRCPRCDGLHLLEQCPQVKAIEYYEDGGVRRVEFHETVRPSEPSAPWWRDKSSCGVVPRVMTCPRCNGSGRLQYFPPLVAGPMVWHICDQCHGHGALWYWSPPAASTSSTGRWPSFDRPDEEE